MLVMNSVLCYGINWAAPCCCRICGREGYYSFIPSQFVYTYASMDVLSAIINSVSNGVENRAVSFN